MPQEDKIYTPTEIEDQPLPNEEQVASASAGGAGADTYSSPTLVDKAIAKTKVARILISESLDTLSKRILGTFQFGKSGAIQIGEQKEGESGDIKISPTGIVARDQAGETTFALDGSTGNATFKGEVKAKDFVVIDEGGLISLASFIFDTITLDSQITRTDSGWGDAAGLSLTLELPRAARVLILATLTGKNPSAYKEGEQLVRFNIDGTPTGIYDLSGREITHSGGGGGYLETPIVGVVSTTLHHVVDLDAGDHIIKIQHRWSVIGNAILIGTTGTEIAGCRLSYLVLGR